MSLVHYFTQRVNHSAERVLQSTSISEGLVAGLVSYVASIWLPDDLRGFTSFAAFGLLFFMMMFLFHDTLFQEMVSSVRKIIHRKGNQIV